MSSSTSHIILFGPQSTAFDATRLDRMRDVLSTSSSLRILHDDILHFETFGKHLEVSEPELELIGVKKTSSLLSDWVKGRNSGILEALAHHPNAIATPLTVINQILLFSQHWSRHYSVDHPVPVTSETTVRGLCVGQLAAAAVRLSPDEVELSRLASVALRLAFCIGAYIDLDRHTSGDKDKSRCLVVGYHDELDDVRRIEEVLDGFNSAYVSVHQHSRVTVTVGESQASDLTRNLNDKGFHVKPIDLFGRFHCCTKDLAVQKILDLATGHIDLQLGTRDTLREMLESIMTIPDDWRSTLHQILPDQDVNETQIIRCIGDNIISPTLAKKLRLQVVVVDVLSTEKIEDNPTDHNVNGGKVAHHQELDTPVPPPYQDDAVAITGMACKFAGSDSLEEFWRILETGTTMYRELPKDRFPDARFQRRKFFQNFKANMLDDVDAFDHKFFGISSREATFMDPQQRLGLQVLYQALDSSGYFARNMSEQEKDMGCYVATCMNEYAENVATHPPSAFSLTGSIRPFIAGKFSYHFGWTGPSIMYDTACSASGTAIHQACRAVASGECKGAVAGGTNVFVSPDTFQNLAAGHFTSPTGGSKSFDAAADGYCRGEGVAFVVLKKLSEALQDDDPILGVLVATAVGHNANECSITVPHGPSQMNLYRKALKNAGLNAHDVSYVEAHGTGTPVGDPIEADSIAGVFGKPPRHHREMTYLGSVKSNVGHTEAASGLSALIKVLLMMQKGVIPRQALFNNLNPAIAPLEPQGIKIPTSNVPWTSEFRAACINNYGASGTNAVMVVTQPPRKNVSMENKFSRSGMMETYPISISAFSPASLAAYCSALLDYIKQADNVNNDVAMNIAFHLSQRMNLSLPYSITSTISSVQDLQELLVSPEDRYCLKSKGTCQPVVLFFGGQTGKIPSVPRAYYDSSAIFRRHLDDCDTTLQALGAPSILPAIFEPLTDDDLILSHSALFSEQYSSAMAWLDCGLQRARLIGHSFGQLTALCVSGALTLYDSLRLVTERARLIKQHMQEHSGSMIVVETDPHQASDLLAQHGSQGLEIACFNGPKSCVVAGSASSVDSFEAFLISTPTPIRCKKLEVNHAYHSVLTEPLVKPLQKIVEQLNIQTPSIPLETCSKDKTWQSFTPALIASHTREPVYFHQAVERISNQLGSCIWLEAGWGNNTSMLRRALGAGSSSHEIKSLTLNPASSLKPLAELTAELWKLGVGVRFWPFHPNQRDHYRVLNLPPYQFDKPRFWLDWKELNVPTIEIPPPAPQPKPLLQLAQKTKEGCEFDINTQCRDWKAICSEHRVVGVFICPLASILDLVTQAIDMLQASSQQMACIYNLRNLTTQLPIPAESEHGLTLSINNAKRPQSWTFAVCSSSDSSRPYASGTISASAAREDRSVGDFARFDRLLDLNHIKNISNYAEADSVKGSAVYKSFAHLFSVPRGGQGVREVSARSNEVAGSLISTSKSPFVGIESCIQVSLIYLNALHNRQNDEIYVNTAVGEVRLSHSFDSSVGRHWIVYSKFSDLEGSDPACDIFVFDAQSERLSAIVLDVTFSRVQIVALQQVLKGTAIPPSPPIGSNDSGFSESLECAEPCIPGTQNPDSQTSNESFDHVTTAPETDLPDLTKALFDLLVRVADVDPDAIRTDVSIADLGIDSLMSMDVAQEINNHFSINVDANELAAVLDVGSLCELVASKTTEFSYKPDPGIRSQSNSPDTTGSGSRGLSSVTSDTDLPSDETELESDESLNAVLKAFDLIREDFDIHAKNTGCDKFSSQVHPQQESLIVSYITEAFQKLGCNISSLKSGETIPNVPHPSRNDKLLTQLMYALRDDGLITQTGDSYIRSSKPVSSKPSSERFNQILTDFPQFVPEHKLLHTVGSKLDECLSGALNPLTLLFGSPEKRKLMADQYLIAPIQCAASQHLCSFIKQCFGSQRRRQPVRVLEVGGGTCGTSLHAVDTFAQLGIPVEYTFSDISASFVREAKSKLGQHGFVKYRTLDITKDPSPDLRNHFDMIFATNTIHATHDASKSTRNARQMLRSGGFLALVECTLRPYYCLDIVFGQLDGWWAFDDGRDHALMDVDGWKASLERAGFENVDWTGSQSRESRILRIILAY